MCAHAIRAAASNKIRYGPNTDVMIILLCGFENVNRTMRCEERACERNEQCQKTDRRRRGRRRVRCGGSSLAGERSWRRRRPPDDGQWQRDHARRGRPQQCAARRCRRPDTICRSCAPFFSGVYCIIQRIIIYYYIAVGIVLLLLLLLSLLLYFFLCFLFFFSPPARHLIPVVFTRAHKTYAKYY